ncbi:hypothetical protein BO71DRAFT_401647 [Aspergillus ellipticus CBS 707.79]|uniref:Metallo-beta-lactamase domain-containing protein n=1 Tax=Aspergillus ellipticus CBS 707.79 TaxID=1448320 RepID=A0A319DIY6_9EURO|nr:hypothetical protein BO71DRAFT_401647 [Aspergillus ellipticus CBS 707.79]
MADSNNGAVQLTFLTTGTVRIRPSMSSQPASNWPLFRRLRCLCDRGWTESLPVGVFVIRHPEGIFLFDTGQSPCCNNPGYFPRVAFLNDLLSQFTIKQFARESEVVILPSHDVDTPRLLAERVVYRPSS